MITQQLLDFINQQNQLGVPPDQIKVGLLASGWQEADIDQAMMAMNIPLANTQTQPPQQPTTQYPTQPTQPPYYQATPDYSAAQYSQYGNETPQSSSKKMIIIVAAAIGVLLLIGGGALAAVSLSKSRQAAKPTAQPSTTATASPASSASSEQLTFASKLKACEKYKGQFTHLLTGEKMNREITGLVDNKCNYIEQMPNGGQMNCKYTQTQREAAANYYKLTATDSGNVSSETKTDPVTGESKTVTIINGKEVENPLNTYMMDGTCVISGYGQTSETGE